jgi:hypothetical protein
VALDYERDDPLVGEEHGRRQSHQAAADNDHWHLFVLHRNHLLSLRRGRYAARPAYANGIS